MADVATVIGAGITVFEALNGMTSSGRAARRSRHDRLWRSIRPPRRGRPRERRASDRRDHHYAAGGIGDAVAEAVDAGLTVHRLASAIPRSGKPEEVVERYGISARHIVEAVRALKVQGALDPVADEPRRPWRVLPAVAFIWSASSSARLLFGGEDLHLGVRVRERAMSASTADAAFLTDQRFIDDVWGDRVAERVCAARPFASAFPCARLAIA
jgi:hypothetical protein